MSKYINIKFSKFVLEKSGLTT